MINEPTYGLTAGKGTDNVALAAALEHVRRRVCCYSMGHVRCDCKYGVSIEDLPPGAGDKLNYDYGSEQTGCPELREVIYRLLHGDGYANTRKS